MLVSSIFDALREQSFLLNHVSSNGITTFIRLASIVVKNWIQQPSIDHQLESNRMVFQHRSNSPTMLVKSTASSIHCCLATELPPPSPPSPPLQQCFHPSCAHCDENFLKTIKSEIKQLTSETELLKVSSSTNTTTINNSQHHHHPLSPFETQRCHFYTLLDAWRSDRVEHITFIYQKKKNQIDLLCSQTLHELETFKIQQKTFYTGETSTSRSSSSSSSSKKNYSLLIPNEIDELNQKLSITRNLLDYFIQPTMSSLHNGHPSSDEDENVDHASNDDEHIHFEELFKQKPSIEFPLATDNLAMACSNSHILLRDGARLLLFDEKIKRHELEIKVQHPGDFVRDLCWSERLGFYLVLTQYLLFTYDPDKHTLTIVNQVKPIDRLKFSSLTCSDNIMFLVNGNGQCVERWSIGNSTWKLVKRWPENEFCHENFRLTSRIRANHLLLALNICDQNFGYRICMFDYQMKFIRRINNDFNLHLLAFINGNQWIATDYKERFYVFGDDDETLQTPIDYSNKGGYIRNICRLGSNSIAVKIINRLQIYQI